jgi:hypothetical protein
MESEWTTIYPHKDHPISIRDSRSAPKMYLRIGTGKRCRRAKLSASEFRKVADVMFSAAEAWDKKFERLKRKGKYFSRLARER